VREKRRASVRGHTIYIEDAAPLLLSYLFARFDPVEQLVNVRMTRGVHSVVGFGECATAVDESVIEVVRQRMDESGFVRLDQVKIVSGPLNSLRHIRAAERAQRVVTLLTNVAWRMRVEVVRSDIVKISAAS
jgi:transcription antitermination factor NusG